MKAIKTIQADKFSLTINERDQLGKYPKHPYSVLTVKDAPKSHFKTKVVSHYVYQSLEEAEAAVNKFVQSLNEATDRKLKQREEKRQANAGVKASDFYKLGDVIVNTWGWEQTNVDFYRVTEVLNKTIRIKAITAKMVEGSMYSHGMACSLLPGDEFIPDGKEYLLRVYPEGRLSNPASYYYMHKHDGREQYCSWYA